MNKVNNWLWQLCRNCWILVSYITEIEDYVYFRYEKILNLNEYIECSTCCLGGQLLCLVFFSCLPTTFCVICPNEVFIRLFLLKRQATSSRTELETRSRHQLLACLHNALHYVQLCTMNHRQKENICVTEMFITDVLKLNTVSVKYNAQNISCSNRWL